MSKKSLSERQEVTDISIAFETDPQKAVEKASTWAKALWKRAADLNGDKQETAMQTAAGWARVSPSTLWKLRYRPPREIGASVYFRLLAAHHKHVESVEASVAANLIAFRALPPTPATQRLVAEMEEFLGLASGETPRTPPEPTRAEAPGEQ